MSQSALDLDETKPSAQILDSIKSFDDTAKQLVTMEGILVGLYFNAFAFAKVAVGPGWQLIVYLLPVVLLVASLLSALRVFFPAGYLELAQEEAHAQRILYSRVAQHKITWFRYASIFAVLSIIGVFFALMTYLLR
ncbi:MAG TPA: hypothetical protein VGT44_17975 [Ktedonobacteraceae bacterium]|nr:hypothetical protein [Ktedonobacteraceae bacterium]